MKILHAQDGLSSCELVTDLVAPADDPMSLEEYPRLMELSHVPPRGVELYDPKYILDLGANYGYSTWELARKYPDASIVAVEMDESNCDVLLENVYQFGDRVTIINAAVSHYSGKIAYGGLARTTYTTLAKGPYQMADAVTIDQIMHALSIPYWDYIKMDIEGSEFGVLKHAGEGKEWYTSWLENTKVIKVEVHENYPGNGLVPNKGDHVEKSGTVEEVVDYLSGAGFDLVDQDYIVLTFAKKIPTKFKDKPDTGGLPSLRPFTFGSRSHVPTHPFHTNDNYPR